MAFIHDMLAKGEVTTRGAVSEVMEFIHDMLAKGEVMTRGCLISYGVHT